MASRIEDLAELSVARACGFAALAIATSMVGYSGDMAAACKAGGLGALLVTGVLLLKAMNARRRDVKATEVWVMLKPEERPNRQIAQQVISTVLRDVYLRFALHSSLIAAALLLIAAFAMLGRA